MKPGYTISSVNTNKTVLEALHDIEKYLQDNHIYKWYSSTEQYTTDKAYQVANVNLQEGDVLEHGDAIMFANGYIATVNAAGAGASEYTVDTPVSLIGPTGATGPQGPQGPRG